MADIGIRFVNATRFLRWFLFLIGLPDFSYGRFYCLKRTWARVCFLVALQAHVYIFIHRSYRYLDYKLFSNMDAFITVADRLVRLIGPVLLHIFLIMKLERTALTLCRKLEAIDPVLNRPDLTSLSFVSAVGVIWIFIVGNVAAGCAIYWEVFVQKIRPIFWLNCVNQFIRVETQMFCTTSAVVFVILGQILTIFYKAAASSKLDIAGLLNVQNQLSATTVYLIKCFTPILLSNCAHIFFCLIFYFHSFLSFLSDLDQLSQTIWDGLWIIEGLVRLWLICGTADAIQDSARTSINTLRHLRVSTTSTGSKRIQMTLAILEINKTQSNLNLSGWVNLSRRLILKMIGSLLTILIILSEFGAKGWASEVITTKNPLSSVGAIEILNNNLQILS